MVPSGLAVSALLPSPCWLPSQAVPRGVGRPSLIPDSHSAGSATPVGKKRTPFPIVFTESLRFEFYWLNFGRLSILAPISRARGMKYPCLEWGGQPPNLTD